MQIVVRVASRRVCISTRSLVMLITVEKTLFSRYLLTRSSVLALSSVPIGAVLTFVCDAVSALLGPSGLSDGSFSSPGAPRCTSRCGRNAVVMSLNCIANFPSIF